MIYGGSAKALYEALRSDHFSPIDLGDEEHLAEFPGARNGVDVAQIYIDKYFEAYKGVAKLIRNQHRYAHKHEFIYTLLGRKRRLPQINGGDFRITSYCERLSVNAKIQGSAADITSSAQNRVDSDPWFVKHRCLMLLQVHDELVFECPEEYVEEAIERIEYLMSHPFGDDVELNLAFKAESDSGDTYADAK